MYKDNTKQSSWCRKLLEDILMSLSHPTTLTVHNACHSCNTIPAAVGTVLEELQSYLQDTRDGQR